MISAQPAGVHYEFKSFPYSSHSFLLDCFKSPGKGLRVLDLGCGNGYLAAALAERGYRVTGVERAEGVDGDFPPNVELVTADLERGLPALSGKFDAVICADVLEHLREPLRLLRQIQSVMAPGAILVASLPNSGNLYFRLNILVGRFPQDDKGLFDRTHVRFFMWKGWVDLLRDSGFALQSVSPTAMPVSLLAPQLGNTLPVRMAEALSYLLARCWKRLFAYQFVVTARAAGQGS